MPILRGMCLCFYSLIIDGINSLTLIEPRGFVVTPLPSYQTASIYYVRTHARTHDTTSRILGIMSVFPWLLPWILSQNNGTLGPLDFDDEPVGEGGREQLWAIWLALGISLYVVGFVLTLVWIFTRDFDGYGPPWVPSIFRTEACCVLIEPLAHIWPALLWPLWLLLLLLYFIFDKTMHATTCCGKEMKRSKRRKRWEMENRRMSAFDDVELLSAASPGSSRTASVNTEPVRTPPPMYQSRVNSVSEFLPQSKGGPSRVNSDPLPRRRASSVSDLIPPAKGSPRKPSRLSVSARADSPDLESMDG